MNRRIPDALAAKSVRAKEEQDMAAELSAGKLRNLMTLADENGRFKMMAIDQRGSMQNLLARVTGKKAEEISYEDVALTKQVITAALAPYASAVLTDPIYGYPDSLTEIPGNVGLLLAYEDSNFDEYGPSGKERKTKLIEGWSVEKAGRAGANAIKLLLYFHPDASADTNNHQKALVRQVGEECARNDLPFLLELVAYALEEGTTDSPAFARRKPDLVARSAQEFSRPEYRVDILKLEFPADLKYSYQFSHKVFDAKEREAVYDLDQVRESCERVDSVSSVPWVILSAGVDISEFILNVELATEAGCSGFLCGRAIWKDAVKRFPDVSAIEEFLDEEGAINFLRANAAAERALPWFEHREFGGLENITLAQRAPDWYLKYGR
jgi:tagatose 1,6-diphosphate aldolase